MNEASVIITLGDQNKAARLGTLLKIKLTEPLDNC